MRGWRESKASTQLPILEPASRIIALMKLNKLHLAAGRAGLNVQWAVGSPPATPVKPAYCHTHTAKAEQILIH